MLQHYLKFHLEKDELEEAMYGKKTRSLEVLHNALVFREQAFDVVEEYLFPKSTSCKEGPPIVVDKGNDMNMAIKQAENMTRADLSRFLYQKSN